MQCTDDNNDIAYEAEDRRVVDDYRFNVFTREQMTENNSLDLDLISDDSAVDFDELPDPLDRAKEIIFQLQSAVRLMERVAVELESLENLWRIATNEKILRIYLDNCCYIRISLEAQAKFLSRILSL